MKHNHKTIAAGVVTSFLLAACGGGSGDSSAAFSTDPTADRTAENEKTVTCTGMTLCLVEEIPAFANERGSGAFPESCSCISGHQK